MLTLTLGFVLFFFFPPIILTTCMCISFCVGLCLSLTLLLSLSVSLPLCCTLSSLSPSPLLTEASGGSSLLNLDFFGPVDESPSSSTTSIPGQLRSKVTVYGQGSRCITTPPLAVFSFFNFFFPLLRLICAWSALTFSSAVVCVFNSVCACASVHTTCVCVGVDPELYELTQAKLDVSGGSSRVVDAFARLMSTVEKTNTSTRSHTHLH